MMTGLFVEAARDRIAKLPAQAKYDGNGLAHPQAGTNASRAAGRNRDIGCLALAGGWDMAARTAGQPLVRSEILQLFLNSQFLPLEFPYRELVCRGPFLLGADLFVQFAVLGSQLTDPTIS